MITKFFLLLFRPSIWTIIEEKNISYQTRNQNVLWGEPDELWSSHSGIRYTLSKPIW